MSELSQRPDYLIKISKNAFTRRQLLAGLGGLGCALATAELERGVMFAEPPLSIQTVLAGRVPEDTWEVSRGVDSEYGEGVLTYTSAGHLLYEPSGEFFFPDREFEYARRSNSADRIESAYDKGANLFDIDANDVNGTVYTEHGIVPQVKVRFGKYLLKSHFPGVLDINEEEIKFGMPSTYEQLIALIGSLSTSKNRLAVSTELKRGDFELSTLYDMFAAHQEYNVPVIMHSPGLHRLKSIDTEIKFS